MKRSQRFFGPQKCPPPPRKLCDSSLRRKIASDCKFLQIFKEKSVPIAVWLATGTFATKNSRRCAIAILGRSECLYRSIQIDYRQHFSEGKLRSNYRYRIVLPEKLVFTTETDLWEYQQKIFHYSYRFSFFEFQVIAITNADFGLETN